MNWVLLMCIPCNMTTVCFCRVCKEVKLCYSFGECRFEGQREGYLGKLEEFRKQEFEDKKTLSKKEEKSLPWTTGYVCQERKTSAERLLLLRYSPETLPSQVSNDCEKNSF